MTGLSWCLLAGVGAWAVVATLAAWFFARVAKQAEVKVAQLAAELVEVQQERDEYEATADFGWSLAMQATWPVRSFNRRAN